MPLLLLQNPIECKEGCKMQCAHRRSNIHATILEWGRGE